MQEKIGEFFEELGAPLSNVRWSWGAISIDSSKLFLRVWDDELETIDDAECIKFLDPGYAGRSSGYAERRRQIKALRTSIERYGVLCTAQSTDEKVRKIASFERGYLLKLGRLVMHRGCIFLEVLDRIEVDAA